MSQELAAERPTAALGDADLVLRTRSGDADAFAELWRRHYRSGIAVARSVTSSLDPDDLVQESYTRIYQSLQSGGGPTGSFRAYLFTSIRNTAATWGRARQETAIDAIDAMEDPSTSDQATAEALDRSLTNQAFRSLPTRWQEVLWYTEIEQMKPAEVAPLLGMKASAVSQLALRAREGLREAWVQAHLRSVEDGSPCQWTIERLGSYARSNISRRDRRKIEEHLADCARCTIVAGEAEEVSNRLALVLLPLTVGIAGTAGYLASLQGGAVPTMAMAAMPPIVTEGAAAPPVAPGAETSAAAAATGSSSSMGMGAMVSLVAATVVVVGGVFAGAAMLGPAHDAAPVPAPGPADQLSIDATVEPPADAEETAPEIVDEADDVPEAPPAPQEPSAPEDATDTVGAAPAPAPAPAPVPPAHPGDEADPGPADEVAIDVGLPDGVPTIVSSSSTIAPDGTVTVTVDLQGEPGATVRARTRGEETARSSLDAAGDGQLVLSAEPWELLVGTRIELRYVAGDLQGQPLGAKLADLL
ncbi:sigma-70 family RNA polymerase sigma factor [Microbacter sp. GSS18]|nr:sigma-70 family RNA polymerase sigma factor [Microbacter sp. GSS18]